MKTIRLLVVAIALNLTACNSESNSTNKAQVLPSIDGFRSIAEVGKVSPSMVVILNDSLNVVCLANACGKVGSSVSCIVSAAAFSCWDVDTAPKKIQELVKKHSQCDVGLSC